MWKLCASADTFTNSHSSVTGCLVGSEGQTNADHRRIEGCYVPEMYPAQAGHSDRPPHNPVRKHFDSTKERRRRCAADGPAEEPCILVGARTRTAWPFDGRSRAVTRLTRSSRATGRTSSRAGSRSRLPRGDVGKIRLRPPIACRSRGRPSRSTTSPEWACGVTQISARAPGNMTRCVAQTGGVDPVA